MEKEIEFMINEISKTELGAKALADSAKMMEKFKLPDLADVPAISGAELPTGVPFKVTDLLTNK